MVFFAFLPCHGLSFDVAIAVLAVRRESVCSHIVAPVRQFSILGAAVRAPGARTRRVRAPRAWCGVYTLVNRNNDVTSLYTCLSRKNYRNCSRH